MLDHISIGVHDFHTSINFYDNTLKTLGYVRLMTFDMADQHVICAGYGQNKPTFWISPRGDEKESVGTARGVHIAFSAPTVEAIHEWHLTCIEWGGLDNGLPSPRPDYHPGYYGAFILDINGWRLEACLHTYINPD